jgi:hypothetical protein
VFVTECDFNRSLIFASKAEEYVSGAPYGDPTPMLATKVTGRNKHVILPHNIFTVQAPG